MIRIDTEKGSFVFSVFGSKVVVEIFRQGRLVDAKSISAEAAFKKIANLIPYAKQIESDGKD